MLEILCKVSFFLSMLVAYAYVTSTSKVIVIVLVYSLCVFSYYYFNVIQSAIDEFLKYFNFNEKFSGNINSAQVPIPYVNPVESASYHNIKYPSLRQMSNYRFDKSTLRHLSKVPKVNSAPAVRIAPPEPISLSSLNDKYVSNNDRYSEDIKNDKYLQVLREISRKRNYQEETDRIDSTPKKSRRNDIKHFMTSHSKRSHDDGSYDNLDDTSRKKRCSDSDRSVAKILSYTSSLMHVVAPNLTWNNHSKKRKSSKIAKSVNESPEKVEKLRKINHEIIAEDIENYHDEQKADNRTYVVKQQIVPVEVHENFESPITNGDECDSRSLYEPPLPDDDGEYVRVASGKILNRTNCMYRKKLNSNRIDPQSIITLEPELVNGNSNDDDEAMKKNLVQNLLDDIERKGEKDDNVIFYENSIVEEIAKNQNKIEPKVPEVAPNIPPPSFNPLLSQNTPNINAEKKSSFGNNLTPKPSIQSPPVPKQLDLSANVTFANNSTTSELKPDSNSVISTTGFNSSILNQSTFNTNPVGSSTINLNQSSNPLFGNTSQVGVDTVDSTPKSNPEKPEEKKDKVETTQAPVNNSISFAALTVTTAESSNAASPKSGFLFPCFTSTAANNGLTNSTSVVNSASFNVSVSSTQQSGSITGVNTTISNTPVINFGTTTASPFSLAPKTDTPKSDAPSSTPQFTNSFAAPTNIAKPAENVQKSPLPGITMFGNTPISTSASGTSESTVAFTSSNIVPSFTSTTPSTQFQFGQSAPAPSTNASTGFSFGSSTSTSTGGFSLSTTTSAPTAFSVSTPAFGSASTSSFNTTSVLSFTTSTPPAFGASTGLKFDAKPTQPAPSFSAPIFNAATTASSFATPSVPSFGSTQNTTFGMAASGGFGATNSTQSNPTFGSTASSQPSAFGAASTPALTFGTTSSQPQTNSTFGNATTQSTPAFGTSQPPAFGTAQNTMFGSGDPSIFSQTAKPAFGATNPPQFGSTGFTFGASSTETQSAPTAFGSTPAATPFGNTGAAQPPSFSSTTPAFNFTPSNPTPFGGNVFGAGAAKPAENTFAFGSGNVASAPAPAQNPVFQFGTAPQQAPQQNQPFTFGSSAGTTTGGFSIGTGGNTRNRASRSRRK